MTFKMIQQMKSLIDQSVEQSIKTKQYFFDNHTEEIAACAKDMASALENGNKILLCGNGGSAADCQHIAAEFINRFQMERRPLPAIALTTDTSIITAIGNDYFFDEIFLKQIQALGNPGDILIAISTSGNSANVIRGVKAAKEKKLTTIGFSGDKGELKTLCDIPFCVISDTTARIQEVHILLAHILCDLVERILFNG